MKTIAVTSGKGGVGKTSLAANLGVTLADMGYRATVFDADLALANIEVVLGTRAEFSLQDVVAEEKTLSEVVKKGPGGVGFIAGGSGVPILMRSGPVRLGLFFDQVKALENSTDVLFFDTAAGLDNRVMSFVKFADEVLLVTTPEPASVTDAYATIKTIFRQKPDATVNIVVNMVDNETEAIEVFEVLRRITNDFVKKDVWYSGFVRRDDNVGLCARKRKPFALAEPETVAKTDTSNLACLIAKDIKLPLTNGSKAA